MKRTSKKRPRVTNTRVSVPTGEATTQTDELRPHYDFDYSKSNPNRFASRQLEPSDRAKIASELLASLDEQDEAIHAAWAAEIERRATDAELDPEAEQDWREALSEIRRDVLSR
jgi:hypothetical protein